MQNVAIPKRLVRELKLLNADRMRAGEEEVEQQADVAAAVELRLVNEQRRLKKRQEGQEGQDERDLQV